jgi:hypothetical protein
VRSRWSPWRGAIWGAGFGVLVVVGSFTMGNRGGPDAQRLVQIIFPAILFALGAAVRNWAVRAAGLASSKALTRKIPGTPTTIAFWLCLGSVGIYGALVSTWHLPAPAPVIWVFAGLVVGLVFHEGGHARRAFEHPGSPHIDGRRAAAAPRPRRRNPAGMAPRAVGRLCSTISHTD